MLVLLAVGCHHHAPAPAIPVATPAPVVAAPDPVDIARAAAAGGDVEGAIASLRERLQIGGEDPRVLHALADIYADAGLPGATLLAERAQAASPTAAWHVAAAGDAIDGGRPVLATVELRAALALDPDHVEANSALGWMALASGDFAMAGACFERLALTGDIDARVGLAIALRGTGDLDAAADLYAGVLAEAPDHAVARYDAALLEARFHGDHAGALSLLDAHPVVDDRIAALRAQVLAWKAEADARAVLDVEVDRIRRSERLRLRELAEAVQTWRTGLLDECRELVIEQATAALDAEAHDVVDDVFELWAGCE